MDGAIRLILSLFRYVISVLVAEKHERARGTRVAKCRFTGGALGLTVKLWIYDLN